MSQNGHRQKNLQINATEHVEKRELSYTTGSNINWLTGMVHIKHNVCELKEIIMMVIR